ncbi:MAG: hypothetical protein F6K30_03780, partial [Cyanothece sp. SIO2G6]|nr:hypothetical protein [Cyanothece sp. SIO2G6]
MKLNTEQVQRSLIENALKEIRQLRQQVKANEDAQREPIAIIGIGCRFPGGANSPADFWQLLANGVDAITPIPSDRWNVDAYYDGDRRTPGKMYTRQGGFIDHPYGFDAHFFGIAPKEARSLDPQQRLLLELSWEALEEAGIVPETLVGSPTGVFVGISSNDYSQQLLNRPASEIDAYLATGNSHSTAAGRLSFTLGLSGPSLALDTACSSSLVSVHIACQQLRDRACNLALAGGVNRILTPEFTINFAKAQMLAEDGRCKTFDASADGFARSEGGGMIVLKRLSDAIADGDEIWAVVRGSAINHDGRSSGLTVPNGPSQQRVIQQALTNSGLEPADISYVEAHGTGTSLGDPIELHALGQVFGNSHATENPLQVGSVKTNVGHLEAGAGIAGIIKLALALRHRQIPPHLHFHNPNPNVAWKGLPLAIPTELAPWSLSEEHDPKSRIAGVSSFGFSGTNAHVILGEFVHSPEPGIFEEPQIPDHEQLDEHLLVLSAKTPQALRDMAERYLSHIQSRPNLSLGDLCFSAAQGRSHFDYRLAIATPGLSQCCDQLQAFIEQFDTSGFDPENIELDDTDGDPLLDTQSERLHKHLNHPLNPLNVFYGQRYPALIDLSDDLTSIILLSDTAKADDSDGSTAKVEAEAAANHPSSQEEYVSITQAAAAYTVGLEIDWESLYPKANNHQRVSLPTYPFQRQQYKVASPSFPPSPPNPKSKVPNPPSTIHHPLLGLPLHVSRTQSRYFEAEISLKADTQFLRDHQIAGSIIFPGVGYIEMMLAAAMTQHNAKSGLAQNQFNSNKHKSSHTTLSEPIQLSNLEFQQPLQLSDEVTTIVQTVIDPDSELSGAHRVEILSQHLHSNHDGVESIEDGWTQHAMAQCHSARSIAHITVGNVHTPVADLSAIRQRCNQWVDPDAVYEMLSDRGIHYGPEFR